MAETTGPEIAAAPPQETAPYDLPMLPYSKETITEMRNFFKNRQKNPTKFTFSKEGDLLKTGDDESVLPLYSYGPIEPSEQQKMDEARLDQLSAIEAKYEEALEALRQALLRFKADGYRAPVLAANAAVAELDSQRNAIRSAERDVEFIGNPETRQILFDQPHETRKLLYTVITFEKPEKNEDEEDEIIGLTNVSVMKFRNYPSWQYAGRYSQTAPAPEAKVAPSPATDRARVQLKDGRMARIFHDAEGDAPNAFLSPNLPIRFTFHDVEVASALQAYEIERATLAGLTELRQSLLKTTAPRTIRILTRKYTAHPESARDIWLAIYTALYQQNPELKEQLLSTGTDTLVFADPRPGPLGIGLASADIAALDATKWKGSNLVGVALETLRTSFRGGEVAEGEGVEEEAEEAVITGEEQAKAKVGAIINARRRGGV
jgi:predicted NAD-dependent protein-ADP-ribosyltransferase YbiA (DUF1768 family)